MPTEELFETGLGTTVEQPVWSGHPAWTEWIKQGRADKIVDWSKFGTGELEQYLLSSPRSGYAHAINQPSDTVDIGTGVKGSLMSPDAPYGDWKINSTYEQVYWDTSEGTQYTVVSKFVRYTNLGIYVQSQNEGIERAISTAVLYIIQALAWLFNVQYNGGWIPVSVKKEEIPEKYYPSSKDKVVLPDKSKPYQGKGASKKPNLLGWLLIGAGAATKTPSLMLGGVISLLRGKK